MKYVDEFRDASHCRRLVAEIHQTAKRPWTIMEVCGGQTHGLLRYGIDQELRGKVELIHGPGCPVCVTPLESIDAALELARRENVLLTSFGDMLRVPGSRESLLQVKASGGRVQMVYSPLDAVRIAQRNPDQEVVFFAVGFETTAPATALAVQQARRLGLKNFSLMVSHVCVLPAMQQLAESSDCRVQGFLAAGHVCTITGYESYKAFAKRFQMPVVVTGFEPVDLLSGILQCVKQLESKSYEVCNQYRRSVITGGNEHALAVVDEVYEVCDQRWRGMGVVAGGGLRLRDQWSQFDASRQFSLPTCIAGNQSQCRSGDVLTGKIKPTQCEYFGRECTPDHPLGAPMVSAEGACSAYHRYSRERGYDI